MSDTDYVRAVEEFFLGLVGQGMALPEGDIRMLLEWKARAVPKEIIQKALQKEADRLTDMGRDELPSRLRLYRGAVEKAISQWQASAEAGFSTKTAPKTENNDILKGLRSVWDTIAPRYRDILAGCLDELRSEHDPDRINNTIIDTLSAAMDETTRQKMDKACADAESRGLHAGMGRMAAKNLGVKVRKQMIIKEVGVDDLFV